MGLRMAMTEEQLMEAVRSLCKYRGLIVFHCHDSRGSWGPGFPDLVVVGPGGVMFREAKSKRGVATARQDWWGARLMEAGADWSIWRPDDLASGRIQRELERLARA